MKTLFLFLLMSAVALLAPAQSLDSLLQQALASNPGLRAEQGEVQAARAAVEVAGSLPMLQTRGGYLLVPVEAPMGMERMRLSVHQMLPPPGVLRYRTQAAEFTSQAREAAVQNMAADVLREVRMAYYELYGLQAGMRTLAEQQANLRQLEPVAVQAYSAGQAPMSQVLRLRARILDLQKQLLQLQAQEQALQARLNGLVNRPARLPLTTADTLLPLFSPQDLEQMRTELQEHPQLELLRQQEAAQQAQTRVNERMRLPEWGIGLEYMLMPGGMSGLMPMVSADIPLFRNRTKAMVRESQAMEAVLASLQEQTQRQLEGELHSALQEWQSAWAYSQLLQEQVALQSSVLRQMTTELSSGMSSLESLLAEENELLMQRLALQETLVMLKKAEADLIYLTGSDYVER
ncbi:TolC family protein [Cesiribacter andamanensis]|uniref:Type I secretion outer membrane protein, TolC family n=1 Tax=Cesiribacter andamanensis AMV16 TaxID=1279009 RepID=M7NW95_9BACT|nr:TolC family protein [Cesiribacter andamanensis]EMR02719.1 type I secretion outer membrane protein, TolC family [Cesiribacter andamanensis AMV16]